MSDGNNLAADGEEEDLGKKSKPRKNRKAA
jgi:hypothetical protein